MPPKKQPQKKKEVSQSATVIIFDSEEKGSGIEKKDKATDKINISVTSREKKQVVISESEATITQGVTKEKELVELKVDASKLTLEQKFDIITRRCVNEEPNTCIINYHLSGLCQQRLVELLFLIICFIFICDSIKR